MLKTNSLFNTITWLIIVTSTGLLVYSTWCGVGLTYDSRDYLSAASSFKIRGDLINVDGGQYIFHAPLFPIIISLIGESPILTLKFLFILLLPVILFILNLDIIGQFKNKIFGIISLSAVGFGVGFQMIFNFIWSEPFFLFAFVLHNFLLVRCLKHRSKYYFILVIIFAFLMSLIRNAGFFLILATTIFLLIYEKKKTLALIYLILSSSGFAAWNLFVIYKNDGYKSIYVENDFFTSILENCFNYCNILSMWLFPGILPEFLRVLLFISLLVIALLLLQKKPQSKVIWIYFSQFIIYLLVMIFLLKVDADEIERLMSIVYPIFVFSVLLLIDQSWHALTYKFRVVLAVMLVTWFFYLGIRTIKNSLMWHQNHCKSQITFKIHSVPDYQLQ